MPRVGGSHRPAAFEHLKRRADFVATSKGARMSDAAFGLQARSRGDAAGTRPRFGITITKKTAPLAVHRNRMRRRVREALRLGAAANGAAGHDYVVVGRDKLLTIAFADLQQALATGLEAVTRRCHKRSNAPRTSAGQ